MNKEHLESALEPNSLSLQTFVTNGKLPKIRLTWTEETNKTTLSNFKDKNVKQLYTAILPEDRYIFAFYSDNSSFKGWTISLNKILSRSSKDYPDSFLEIDVWSLGTPINEQLEPEQLEPETVQLAAEILICQRLITLLRPFGF